MPLGFNCLIYENSMSESADDLSKSEEISLNISLNKCYLEEDSPNFADTYNAWRKYVFL